MEFVAPQIDTAQVEVLMRSPCKTGITALVDEATGYQYDREHDELQKYSKRIFQKRYCRGKEGFPDVFLQELFRLNGWRLYGQ